MNYDLFYQNKGGKPAKVESWSHFNDPIPKDGQPHGNSRRHGDASPEVQALVIDTIVAECHKRGFSREDTAHVLAIARIESGFNPDAAAGESSASGIGQFIDKTGAGYGIKDANRFNLSDNVKALVDHFEDNKNLAFSKGKDAAWVYKFHHDGPVNNSGGLSMARSDVLPHARSYADSELLKDFKSNGPSALGTGARVDSEFKRERAAPEVGRGHGDATQAKLHGPRTKITFDLKQFQADFKKQLEANRPSGAEFEQRSERSPITDLNSTGARSEASAISLSLALKEHLMEKGFDASTVAKAQSLADTLKAMDSREAAGSLLVIHKEGAAVATLVPKSDQVAGLQQGDSVLVADRLKALSSNGLDVDAVAVLRGLAPNQTQQRSDLEVYQAAPPPLYEKAQTLGTTTHSAKDTQDLLQGLSTQDKLHTPQPESRPTAAAKETQQAAEMSMGT